MHAFRYRSWTFWPRAVACLAGLSLAVTITGCGGKDDGGDVPPPAPRPAVARCPSAPTAPALDPAEEHQVSVKDLRVLDGKVQPDGRINVSGRRHYLAGTLASPLPADTRLWVVTHPASGGYYLQAGPVVAATASGGFATSFNLGINDVPAAGSNEVRLVQVAAATGAYFTSCHPTAEVNPRLPNVPPWHEVGQLVVLKS
ncbi:hypothetical protein [Frankia sp. AgKG'84/4]|uniref:hypothetical protein n=1 Tax=Frankia sp. AgKG'84/4 TaxID=573490 RepID=UPI00200E3FE0|nr:hypothetical protein [Frankia sp. AgKG'84/4]MCL9793813.1 hypothetical protein [Frankia sp. AgKG'84/4]